MTYTPTTESMYRYALASDATVRNAVSQADGLKLAIAHLVMEKQALVRKLIEIEAIAPRSYRMPDGRIMVWQCPEHLIPITDTSKLEAQ